MQYFRPKVGAIDFKRKLALKNAKFFDKNGAKIVCGGMWNKRNKYENITLMKLDV